MSITTERQAHCPDNGRDHNLTVENFIIVWLDAGLSDRVYDIVRRKLQKYVHLIIHCADPNQCINFLADIINEKVFLIISGGLGQQIVPLIHDFHQIDSIYVYCGNKSIHEVWAVNEKKVRGVYNNIKPIYDALRRDVRQCEDDSVSFHVFPLSCNKTRQLFIYTQALKEILIETDYPPDVKTKFASSCLSFYSDNSYQLNNIDEFSKSYRPSESIRWYTRECFLSSMLNKAFRMQDFNALLAMGFFLRDIVRQMKEIHFNSNRLTVYRGQGISSKALHTLLNASNGFISFDSFLITTNDRNLSLDYARSAQTNHQLIGVLFKIEVERSKAAVFTPLDNISYYSEAKNEILFSVNTIFHIHSLQEIEHEIYEVHLRLTTDEQQGLNDIIEFIRKEIEGDTGKEQWDSLMKKFKSLHDCPQPPNNA